MTTAVAGRRGILGGAVLLAIGAAFLLPPLGVPNAGAYLFVALGLAFAAAWWVGARRQYVYLVPACVLIGFGLGLVLPPLLGLPGETAGPVFLGTLAVGLAVAFVLAPTRRAPMLLAGVLAVVALADLSPDRPRSGRAPAVLRSGDPRRRRSLPSCRTPRPLRAA